MKRDKKPANDKIHRMNITETSRKILAAIKDSDLIGASQMVLELERYALKLVEENASLQARLEELESHPDLVSSMRFDGTFYWQGEDDEKQGPYCQKCLDGERRAILMRFTDKTVSGYESKWYECHNCQSRIEV